MRFNSLSRRQLLASLGTTITAGVALPAELPTSTRELWGWIRAQPLLDPAITYLDTATIGPSLRAALVTEYRQQEQFNTDVQVYLQNFLAPASIRSLATRLSTLLDCQPEEVTITQGASEALALLAYGLTLTTGDEVLIAANTHSSCIYPWLLRAQRTGVVVKQVALPSPLSSPEQVLEAFAAEITDKTRVLVFSHVQHTDGAVLPAIELCALARRHNILTVIDGAQALGSIDISMQALGCDCYAASLHKWMNGPHGLGLLFVRSALLGRLAPLSVDSHLGWDVLNRYGQARLDDEAGRATWPAALAKFGNALRFLGPKVRALESTLDLRAQLGNERIHARIRELAMYARLRLQSLADLEILTPAAPGMWAGILAFRSRHRPSQELTQRLRRNHKITAAAVSLVGSAPEPSAAVRVGFHIFNSHDDVERLVRALS